MTRNLDEIYFATLEVHEILQATNKECDGRGFRLNEGSILWIAVFESDIMDIWFSKWMKGESIVFSKKKLTTKSQNFINERIMTRFGR